VSLAPRFALAAVLAMLAATGCASAGSDMATDSASGRGWIVVDDAAAAAVLRTCSRPSPDREAALPRWTPAQRDIDALERALPSLAPGTDPARFHRQYVGFVRDGKRLVYVNAWPVRVPSPSDPAREAVRVCDGGAQFWGAVWDPESGAFSEREANGGF
jgi:hypothetical protein